MERFVLSRGAHQFFTQRRGEKEAARWRLCAGTKRQGGCAPIFSTKKDVGFLLPTIILSRCSRWSFTQNPLIFHAERIGFSRRGAEKKRLRGGDFHAGIKRQGGCAVETFMRGQRDKEAAPRIFPRKKMWAFSCQPSFFHATPFILSHKVHHSFIQSASFLPLKCVILSRGVHLSYSISMSFLHAETQRQGVFSYCIASLSLRLCVKRTKHRLFYLRISA